MTQIPFKKQLEQFERDFFIYRICSGKIRYKELIVQNPNIDILAESSELYYNIYYDALYSGVMTDAQIYQFMVDNNLWSEREEKELNDILPKHIEEFKILLFKERGNKAAVEQTRLYLEKAKKELITLFARRHAWDHLSCHGVASFSKWHYTIKNSTYLDGKLYDWTKYTETEVLDYINKNQLDESKLRELVRTDPWRTIWSTKKVGNIFNSSACEFSEDQKRLVIFSCFYDSIYENPEAPSEEVIEDDDMLDGWVLLKKRENTKEKQRNEILEKVGKNGNANEVFVVTSPEDAKKVYELNDNTAQYIARSRLEMIKEKGVVDYQDFNDVQNELRIQMNRKQHGAR